MRFSDYLTESGHKLTALAEKIGCEASTLHDIKTGRRRPSLALALRIKDATDGAVAPEDFAEEPAQ